MPFGTFNVTAGDFRKCDDVSQAIDGYLYMKKPRFSFFREKIKMSEIETVEVATEESVKKLGGTIGWGAAGGIILGPVGLLAGLILGGKKTEVTFICKFKDGRKFLGTASAKVYKTILAGAF